MEKNERPPTLAILPVTLFLLAIFLFLVVFFGLTQTKTYEQVSRHTEGYQLPQEPYDLNDAVGRGKAFTIEYPFDGEFTLL